MKRDGVPPPLIQYVKQSASMDPIEILSVQMELSFGTNGRPQLKEMVNAALDSGEWHEDFDIAVTQAELDNKEAQRLLSAGR